MRAPLFARHACTLPALRMAPAPRMLLDPGVSSLLALTSVDLLDVSSDATVASLMDEIAQAQLAAEKAIETKEIVESTLGGLGQDIMVFLAASVCVAPLGKALNLSPVLLYLVIGCAMGPFGFDLFADKEIDSELGELGILFLLFVEGLNLSPERIKALASFFSLGAAQMLLSIGLIFFALFVGTPFVFPFVDSVLDINDDLVSSIISKPVVAFSIAAAGALSSSAFVLPVLKEKGWESKPDGIAALSILLLQDLAVAPLLVILPLAAEYDRGGGVLTEDPGQLALFMAEAIFGFGAVIAAGSLGLKEIFKKVASAGTSSFVAASLLVSIGLGVIADKLGLSATTGAFAAGVLLAESGYRAQIEADIKPFEGILLGVFFVTAGASLDPMLVLHEWPTLLAGISAFLAMKTAVIFTAGEFALGLSRADAVRVSLLLAGGGEFAFVIFKLAEDLDVIPGELNKLLIASVILSMALTPVLGEIAEYLGNQLDERGLGSSLTCVPTSTSTSTTTEGTAVAEAKPGAEPARSIAPAADAFVVCGYGEVGHAVAAELLETVGANGYVAFDRDPQRVEAGASYGHTVVYGNGCSSDVIRASGVERPRAIIVAHDSPERCIESTQMLQIAFPNAPIYARAAGAEVAKQLLKEGAAKVILESAQVGRALGKCITTGCDTSPLEALEGLEGLVVPTAGSVSAPASDSAPVSGSVPNKEEYIAAVCAEDFCVPYEVIVQLSQQTGLDKPQIVALQQLWATAPERDARGNANLAEMRDEIVRMNKTPMDDATLKAWVGYEELLSKWVSEDEEATFVTFEQLVEFASKNAKLDLPVEGSEGRRVRI